MSTTCKTCGATISDDETHCPYCDSLIERHSETMNTLNDELPYSTINPIHNDTLPAHIATTEEFGRAKFWSFVIISFLLPIIGWILYFVYEDKNIEAARTFSKFAWYGILFNLVLYTLSHC